MTEELTQMEEEVQIDHRCGYNRAIECVNEDRIEVTYCTNCLRAQLVRELRLIRVTS